MGAGVWAGAGASLRPHVHKEVLPKRNRRTRKNKEQRANTKRKAGTFLAVQCTGYLFGGIQYRRYLLGDIQCQRYLLGGIQCWRYLSSGIESWYSFGGIESWRYFLAVSRVGGTFLAEAVKPKYDGIFRR